MDPDVASCRFCASGEVTSLGRFTDRLYRHPGEFELVRCRRCGTVSLPHPPANLDRYYSDDYFNELLDPPPGRAPRRGKRTLKVELVEEALADRPGRVLDIGCGTGAALSAYAAAGWTTTGVEPGPAGVARARAAGHHVVPGPFPSKDLHGERFDLVRFHHSLEHLPDVRRALEAAWDLLHPGGRLQVDLPNVAGWISASSRRWYWQLDPPRHLCLPPPGSLRRTLTGLGFTDVTTRTATEGFSLANSYALWRRRDELRRPEGWRLLDPDKPRGYRTVAAVGTAASAVADRLRCGDNVRISARRP